MSHLIHSAPLLTPLPLLASKRRRNHDHESEWEDVEDDDDDEDLDRFCRDCAMLRAMRVDGLSTSAKLRKIMEILDEIEDRGEGEKTIVFSQCGWPFVFCCACVGSDVGDVGTSMLDLCEQVFARHGIRSLRYDGSMNREAREYCLMEFRRPTGPKVVLVRYVVCTSVDIALPNSYAQHQVRWCWLEPRVCQPRHQVSSSLA